VPAYIVAQFAGAIAAAAAVWGFYGAQARSVAHLAATSPAAGVGTWRAFSVEAVVTFILVLVIISVATDKRVPAGIAPLAIGTALGVAIFISGPVSGAGVNPARAIGPMIVANRFGDWWIYLVAPLLGGVAAATLYHGVLQPAETP
jgi:glycerol uptake facilitator-like aquaporin